MTIVKERPAIKAAKPANSPDPLADARFLPIDASRATGVPIDNVRSWFKRGILTLDDDEFGHAPEMAGHGRQLSARTVLVIAIMGRLTGTIDRNKREGMSLEAARRAAYEFAHSGEDGRLPGMIFAEGETLLLIAKNTEHGLAGRVVQSGYGEKSLSYEQMRRACKSKQFEILPLTELWQDTLQRLGIRGEVERAAGM